MKRGLRDGIGKVKGFTGGYLLRRESGDGDWQVDRRSDPGSDCLHIRDFSQPPVMAGTIET
jgi:hypothetical protein